jgi:hypothetical protein
MASVTITITDVGDDKVTVAAQFSDNGMSTVYPSHHVALEMLNLAAFMAAENDGNQGGMLQ